MTAFNKLQLTGDLVDREMESAAEDPSHPNRFTTYMSYIFPIIKYHSRDDVTLTDTLAYYKDAEQTYFLKGGWGQYKYCVQKDLYWDTIHNETTVSVAAKTYFPKILELCRENNISSFFFMMNLPPIVL